MNDERGVAIYPGSFDPITKGHTSILRSGLVAFDKIIVAVLNNEQKQPLFTVQERIEMIQESVIAMGEDPSRVEVDSFEGLLIEYARSKGVRIILRGLRAVADFEYELQMANMNRHLNEDIETMFIMANDAYFYVASNLVKEVTKLGGDVTKLVPPPVIPRLRKKLGLD
ncbi:MAG: pantetheine-phosphate adenylyltransferase [Polyangiales bacterium]